MKIFLSIALLTSTSFAQEMSSKGEEVAAFIDARDELGSIETYIDGREKVFAIQGKSNDMFGLPQDPKKAQQVQQVTRAAVSEPTVALPLQEIVDALPVTMIDPAGDRVIMSGAPPFSKGQTFELNYRGRPVVLIFEGSRTNGAYFREMKSRKLKLHRMMKLPKGIKKGVHGQAIAKGINRVNPNQPEKFMLDINVSGGPGGPPPSN